MSRILTLAAVFALALPTLGAAEEHHEHRGGPAGHPAGRPHVMAPGHPAGVPHRAGGAMMGPHHMAGPMHGHQFAYHGHMFARMHAAPYMYPHGWGYRRWAIGAVLPGMFLVPAYYYANWQPLGLAPPPPGFQWVRYGPDLLLVNVTTGQVVDAVYGAFY